MADKIHTLSVIIFNGNGANAQSKGRDSQNR